MKSKFNFSHQLKTGSVARDVKSVTSLIFQSVMEEQIPALDGAGESAEELELTPTVPTEPEEQGGDPLDEISDETARAEAKKWRSIARRMEKKEHVAPVAKPAAETPKPEPKPEAPAQEFLTKADFYKANERKAVREAIADAEVKANWSEIITFYTPRRGKETPEDIAEDIRDAITIFNARNAQKSKDDSAKELSTTKVVKAGGGAQGTTPKTTEPPNFKLPIQPKDWYAKK